MKFLNDLIYKNLSIICTKYIKKENNDFFEIGFWSSLAREDCLFLSKHILKDYFEK
jgi:hypothetical protein